jgi:hypothetical protein
MKKLNTDTKELLIGLILGDGHIDRSNDRSFITMEQTTKHSDYMFYIYRLLVDSGVSLYPMKYYSRSDKRYNSINESIYFKSYNLANLNFLADMFILNHTKVIPSNIKDWLTPISLAHWICGDGQLVKKGGITLCTDNYTLDEVEILIHGLKYKFDADCSIHKKKGKSNKIYYRIYIKKTSFDAIKPLIKEHIHESFLYKLHY